MKVIFRITFLAFALGIGYWVFFSKEKLPDRDAYTAMLNAHPYLNRTADMLDTIGGIPRYTRPDLAYELDFIRTMDPVLGRPAPERLWLAKKEFDKRNETRSELSKAVIPGLYWYQRGPQSVADRTRAIMIDPNNPTAAWAGGSSGGLWYNANYFNSSTEWQIVDDFWANIAITSIAYDPSHTDTFYVATGEGWFFQNSSGVRGNGIWRSTDGGANWSQLSSTTGTNFDYIQKIIVHPTNGDVYAATKNNGVMRSQDEGATWTKVLGAGTGAAVNEAADIDIASNGKVFATMGIWTIDGLYTSNTGNATTWAKVNTAGSGLPTGLIYRGEVAVAPSNANYVYVAFQSAVTFGVDSIYVSTNGGTTFGPYKAPVDADLGIPATDFTNAISWYSLTLEVDPNNATDIVVGSLDLFRSTNSGASWSQISRWNTVNNNLDLLTCSEVHADQHTVVFYPGSSDTVLIGNDGGVYLTDSLTVAATKDVIQPRNNGYIVTQFYSTALYPVSGSNIILGGTQDNGTQRYKDADINTTTEVSGGDGGYCFFDEDDAGVAISSYPNNHFLVSADTGKTFTEFTGNNNNGLFTSPAAYHDEKDVLFISYKNDKIERISNVGGTITRDSIYTSVMGASMASHIVVSPFSHIGDSRLFVGTMAGKVMKITTAHSGYDKTTSTTDLTGVSFPSGAVSGIEILDEASPPDSLIVTFSNYGVTSVWLTLNGGTTWVSKEGDLPDMPVRWVLKDPTDVSNVLLATEVGVWATKDIFATSPTWKPQSAGLSNVRVDMFRYRDADKTVVAATYGRGMYTGQFLGTPGVGFIGSLDTTLVDEGATTTSSGCRSYQDFDLNMIMTAPPDSTAMAIFTITGGVDTTQYDLIIPTRLEPPFFPGQDVIVFDPGFTGMKPFTLRIYDDKAVEGDQTLMLNYTVSGNSDAAPISGPLTFTIEDDDIDPTYLIRDTLLSEDWLAGDLMTNGWTGFGGGNLMVGPPMDSILGGDGNAILFMGNPQQTVYSLSLTSDTLDASGYHTVRIDYLLQMNNQHNSGTGNIDVEYKATGSSTWSTLETFSNPTGDTTITNTRTDADLVGMGDTTFQIRFRYNGTNSLTLDEIAIDNIALVGLNNATISSVTVSDTAYFGPNMTMVVYDNFNQIIGSVTNMSTWDYGCTSFEIDRIGTGAVEFTSTTPNLWTTDKSFLITPTHNPTCDCHLYSIRLFFTEAEVQGWEDSTGKDRSIMRIIKTDNPIANDDVTGFELDMSANLQPFGFDWVLEGNFTTGFSGVSGTTEPEALSAAEILLFGEKNREGIALDIYLREDLPIREFVLERSVDNRFFEPIHDEHTGNKDRFSYLDREVTSLEKNEFYYRVAGKDENGQTHYSNVVAITWQPEGPGIRIAGPIGENEYKIYMNVAAKIPVLRVINMEGKVVYHETSKTINIFKVPVEVVPGIYLLEVSDEEGSRAMTKIVVW